MDRRGLIRPAILLLVSLAASVEAADRSLQALVEVSRRAGVAIAVDNEVDLEILDIADVSSIHSASDLNDRLIHFGLIVVEVDPTLWRVALDPLPRFPLGRREVLMAANTVIRPVDPVIYAPESGPESRSGVDRIVALTGNLYGAGERLYSRGIPRNRWQSDREDIGVYWNGLPLPDFALDASDLVLAGHSIAARRGPGPRQDRPTPSYAGSVELTSRLPGNSVEVATTDQSEHAATAGLRLSAESGAWSTGIQLHQHRRANPSPSTQEAESFADTRQLSAHLAWTGKQWDTALDAIILETDSAPRAWNVYATDTQEISTPFFTESNSRAQAARFRASRLIGTQGKMMLDLGKLSASGEYLVYDRPGLRADDAQERDLWQARFGYEAWTESLLDYGVTLSATRMRDANAATELRPLVSSSLFSGPLRPSELVEQARFGRIETTGSEHKRVAATGWLAGSLNRFSWEASVRVEDAQLALIRDIAPAFEGEPGCEVTPVRTVTVGGQTLYQDLAVPCSDLADLLLGDAATLATPSGSDTFVTADVSVDWRATDRQTVSVRAYNRIRPGGLAFNATSSEDIGLRPDEQMIGVELGHAYSTVHFRNRFVLFFVDLDRGADARPAYLDEAYLWDWVAGAELDGEWNPTDSQKLSWSIGYLRSQTESSTLPSGAPEWSGSLRHEIEVLPRTFLSSSVAFASEAQVERLSEPLARQTAYERLDVYLLHRWRNLEVGLGVRNATDEYYIETTYESTGATGNGVRYGQGRTGTAWLRWQF